MSSDYSSQEPRSLAAMCYTQLNDSQMRDTFLQGKDLYAEIASKSFNKPYEDCLEFYLDENGNKTTETNVEGKERRSQAKKILLGALYGRGTASVAEQLGCTIEKAQEIKDSVFKAFPAIKKFEETSMDMAKNLGYVTTVCGTKRRLPELQLDEFEFHWANGVSPNTDILDFTELTEVSDIVPQDIANKYLVKLRHAKVSQKQYIISEARQNGITIIDNGGKIADAQRQVVNSRVQGSAANLTKLAMIHLNSDIRLKELGFRLLVPVHDEVIAECPKENAKECARLLSEIMSKAAEEILKMPIGCDVTVSQCWYGEELDLDTL